MSALAHKKKHVNIEEPNTSSSEKSYPVCALFLTSAFLKSFSLKQNSVTTIYNRKTVCKSLGQWQKRCVN